MHTLLNKIINITAPQELTSSFLKSFYNVTTHEIFLQYKNIFTGEYNGKNIQDIPGKLEHIEQTTIFLDYLDKREIENIIRCIEGLTDADTILVTKYLHRLSEQYHALPVHKQVLYKLAQAFHDVGYVEGNRPEHVQVSARIFTELFHDKLTSSEIKYVTDIILSHSYLAGAGVFTKKDFDTTLANTEIKFERLLIELLDGVKVFNNRAVSKISVKLQPEIIAFIENCNDGLYSSPDQFFLLKLKSLFSSVHFGQVSEDNVKLFKTSMESYFQQGLVAAEDFKNFINNDFCIRPFFFSKDFLEKKVSMGEGRFYDITPDKINLFFKFLLMCYFKYKENPKKNKIFSLKDIGTYYKSSEEYRTATVIALTKAIQVNPINCFDKLNEIFIVSEQ